MRLFLYACFIFFYSSSALAGDQVYFSTSPQKILGSSAIAGISSALSNSDIALCKSMIYPPHLKGDYGEVIVGKIYLEQHLNKSGSWQSVSARFGRQGIDQIYIKYDTENNDHKKVFYGIDLSKSFDPSFSGTYADGYYFRRSARHSNHPAGAI